MSAPRPAQDQVPSSRRRHSSPRSGRGLWRGHRSAPPPPAGLGRGGLGVYIWPDSGPRARRAQTPRPAGTQSPGQEVGGGCGEAKT